MKNNNGMAVGQEDVISITDIIVVFLQHWRLWLVVIILGVVGTAGAVLFHADQYKFSVNLQPPYVVKNGKKEQLVTSDDFTLYAQDAITRFQASGYSSSSELDSLVKEMSLVVPDNQNKALAVSLHVTAPLAAEAQVKQAFSGFLPHLNANKNLQDDVSKWRDNMQYKINATQELIDNYQKELKNQQQEIGVLRSQLAGEKVSSEQIGLLVAIMSNANRYQKKVFDLTAYKKKLQQEISSIQPEVKALGDAIYSTKPVGLSKGLIVALGLILSLFFACIVVFCWHYCKTVRMEIKEQSQL